MRSILMKIVNERIKEKGMTLEGHGDFRHPVRYMAELIFMDFHIGHNNLLSMLRITDEEYEHWRDTEILQDKNGMLTSRVYEIVEIWVILCKAHRTMDAAAERLFQSQNWGQGLMINLFELLCSPDISQFHRATVLDSDIVFTRNMS